MLRGERVLLSGTAEHAHAPGARRLAVAGTGAVADLLQAFVENSSLPPLWVFCQDTMDLTAVRRFGMQRRAAGEEWLWATTGPMARAFVSPVFLPAAGPCAGCLLAAFRRRSPAPDLHDALLSHGERGGDFSPPPADPAVCTIVAALARWKVARWSANLPPPAVYKLHALECDSMTVRAVVLPRAFDCRDCQEGR